MRLRQYLFDVVVDKQAPMESKSTFIVLDKIQSPTLLPVALPSNSRHHTADSPATACRIPGFKLKWGQQFHDLCTKITLAPDERATFLRTDLACLVEIGKSFRLAISTFEYPDGLLAYQHFLATLAEPVAFVDFERMPLFCRNDSQRLL